MGEGRGAHFENRPSLLALPTCLKTPLHRGLLATVLGETRTQGVSSWL